MPHVHFKPRNAALTLACVHHFQARDMFAYCIAASEYNFSSGNMTLVGKEYLTILRYQHIAYHNIPSVIICQHVSIDGQIYFAVDRVIVWQLYVGCWRTGTSSALNEILFGVSLGIL